MLELILPDGSKREVEAGSSVYDAVRQISEGLARAAVGVELNGEVMGLAQPITEGGNFVVLKFDDLKGKKIFWHTSSHVLAAAVKRLFPDVKLAIGPATDNGFYYDFDTEHRFIPEDLEKIEAEMQKIVKEKQDLVYETLSRADALSMFEKMGEPYKVELINDLPDEDVISIYKMGDFVDLCKGPHLMNNGSIKAIKLLNIAGAYWRGSEKNKMLQRIYGVSYEKKSQLDEYIVFLEEAAKRDHRKLGKELDLFTIQEEGPGFPFFHPNGMVIKNELENWWRKVLTKKGYGEIKTPLILSEALWHQSGHWDHYKENMYFTKIDDGDYAVKPMNCPGAILVYKSKMYSYRDLPLKLSEFGQVHRHELSGALHGLFRVRTFVQDDAHVFMLPSQIKEQIVEIMELANYLYGVFGFKHRVVLSTRPDDFMGDIADWDRAEAALAQALEESGTAYTINAGDGAFYGPKIDLLLSDAIGREWQCGTIQLDFQLPERFDLTYVDSDGEKKRPVMVHRALLGSEERFIGSLIEHFAGRFPSWIAPIQVKVLPISEKFSEYAKSVNDFLLDNDIRVEVDYRAEKIGKKIREAQLLKVPYMLVVGEKEVEAKQVSVRRRDGVELGSMSIEAFYDMLNAEIKEKKIID